MTLKTTLLIAALIAVSNTASAEYEPTKRKLQGWLSSNLSGCFLHPAVKGCMNTRIQFSENKLIYRVDGSSTTFTNGVTFTSTKTWTLNLSSSVDIRAQRAFDDYPSLVNIECDNCWHYRSQDMPDYEYVEYSRASSMYTTIPHKAAIVLKRLIEVSGGNVSSIDLD